MDDIEQRRVTACACPECGKKLDAVTPVNDVRAMPVEGDLSICIGCATPLVFNAEGTLDRLTDEVRNTLPMQYQVQIVHAISAVHSMQLFERLRKST